MLVVKPAIGGAIASVKLISKVARLEPPGPVTSKVTRYAPTPSYVKEGEASIESATPSLWKSHW